MGLKMVRASLILSVLQNAVYIALLTLGCYFIYQGKVVQRYLIQRTDFSEHSEAMSELPTLTTFILPFETLTFGKDFNVSFYPRGSSIKRNLSIGTNNISNTLQADFEQIYGVSIFKITPLNFSHGDPLDYNLYYYFEESLLLGNKTFQVGIRVSTENNSIPLSNQTRDGEAEELHLNVGSVLFINQIRPEKYIYNKDIQKCREIPYNELLLKMISNRVWSCPNPCTPYYYGRHLDAILGKLPSCRNDAELQCFMDIQKNTEDTLLQNDALMKPCTKVNYKYTHMRLENQQVDEYSTPKNWAWVRFQYTSPLRITVKEEYVIYDAIAMIGAIGGTLGLCIGFSFMDCVSYAFKLIEGGIERVSKKRSRSGPVQESAVPDQEMDITARLERLEQSENKVQQILKDMRSQQDDMQAQLNAILPK